MLNQMGSRQPWFPEDVTGVRLLMYSQVGLLNRPVLFMARDLSLIQMALGRNNQALSAQEMMPGNVVVQSSPHCERKTGKALLAQVEINHC